jgi:hypothetical protein
MKFLCIPCDSPMKLQSVGPPDRGSLSVVYACPECGYEMAMLTNAYETQVVQSLGVRIGPSTGEAVSSRVQAAGASANPVESPAEAGTSTGRCPFSAMIPSTEGMAESPQRQPEEPIPIRWSGAAEARLANIPAFVRPMARTGIERFARERGAVEVDEEILDAAREFFGM